jgi:hypothetical protein
MAAKKGSKGKGKAGKGKLKIGGPGGRNKSGKGIGRT